MNLCTYKNRHGKTYYACKLVHENSKATLFRFLIWEKEGGEKKKKDDKTRQDLVTVSLNFYIISKNDATMFCGLANTKQLFLDTLFFPVLFLFSFWFLMSIYQSHIPCFAANLQEQERSSYFTYSRINFILVSCCLDILYIRI